MVLLHKIASNIIDSHPVTMKTSFRNETILRLSYIFTMPFSNELKTNRWTKKTKKGERFFKSWRESYNSCKYSANILRGIYIF